MDGVVTKMNLTIFALGIVVLISHFLEGITGFGCTVMAMPFAIILVGLSTARPVLTIIAFLMCLYIAVISYKNINWKILRHIVIFMGIGMPAGMLLYSVLPKAVLMKTLAVFMILVSLRGLLMSSGKKMFNFKFTDRMLNVFLLLGGVIHGAFTSGGPLVIIYAMEKLKDKTEFRATLCAMWTITNGIITVQQILSRQITPEVISAVLWMLPFLILGVIAGNMAHYRINDKFFTKLSYIILSISAVFMLV